MTGCFGDNSRFSQSHSQLCIQSGPTKHEQYIIQVFLTVCLFSRPLIIILVHNKAIKNVLVFEFIPMAHCRNDKRHSDERRKSSEEFQFPRNNELENYNYFSLI